MDILKGLGAALVVAISATAAQAGGDSTPVYTDYDQSAQVRMAPYTPPPTTVITRERAAEIYVVPAVVYNPCCCNGNLTMAMNIAAGGQFFVSN